MNAQTTQALRQYHERGRPLAGALRVASLQITGGNDGSLSALFATCLASHGHAPQWSDLRALAACAHALYPRTFATGRPVTLAGAPTDALYIVHAGAVRVDGADALARAMSVHGIWGAVSGGACRHTVVAARTSILLALPAAAAAHLATTCPVAARLLSGVPARAVTDGGWPRVASVSSG